MAMKELDLLIKNAKIVTADTTFSGQIGSRDGKIVYIGAAGEEALPQKQWISRASTCCPEP